MTEYSTVRLADNLWAIKETMVQCYLCVGKDKALLFDCGISDSQEFADTVKSLTDLPVRLAFSHTDQDHTGARRFFGGPAMHPAEYAYYAQRTKATDKGDIVPLWDGDVIDLGGVELEVVLIPGHTPGSIALLNRQARSIFVGDSLSDAWIYMFGEGRNLAAFIASMDRLDKLSASFDRIYACHGSEVLGVEWVAKTSSAARRLLAGELEGKQPPMNLPCQLYSYDGVNLLYDNSVE